jgi:hypothetical protein
MEYQIFSAPCDRDDFVMANLAREFVRVGRCDGTFPLHRRADNRAPDQVGTQIADDGFDFGEFGHWLALFIEPDFAQGEE